MTKKKKEKQKLPEPLETQRNYVLCGPIVNTHVSAQARGGSLRLSGCCAASRLCHMQFRVLHVLPILTASKQAVYIATAPQLLRRKQLCWVVSI